MDPNKWPQFITKGKEVLSPANLDIKPTQRFDPTSSQLHTLSAHLIQPNSASSLSAVTTSAQLDFTEE